MSGEAGMDQLPDGARGQFTQLLDLHEAVRMLLHPLDQSLHLAFVPRRRSAGTETEHQAHRSLGQAWQEEVQEFKGAQISELDVVDDHKDGAAVAGQLQQGPDKVPGDHSIGQHEAVPRDGTGGHGLLRRFLKGRDRTPAPGTRTDAMSGTAAMALRRSTPSQFLLRADFDVALRCRSTSSTGPNRLPRPTRGVQRTGTTRRPGCQAARWAMRSSSAVLPIPESPRTTTPPPC